MENTDLEYWKGWNILAAHGDFYYPATIIAADNDSGSLCVEFRNGSVAKYVDVFNAKSLSIICDIIPPYADIMNNAKVAMRIEPYPFFAPGFVCEKIWQREQLLVKLYTGVEKIVGPEDVRFMIPLWNPYSVNYLQRNISYTNSNINVCQSQFPPLPNHYYYQQEAFQQMQEMRIPLPMSSEMPRQFPLLSANNFSGCQIIEKENLTTEHLKCCTANDIHSNVSDNNLQYHSVFDADRVNHWNNFNVHYEKNLSYSYSNATLDELKKNMMVAPESVYCYQAKDESCVYEVPESVKNVPVSTTNCAPRVKRKYTKRKNLPFKLPKKSQFAPSEQPNFIKTRKPNSFFMFCKEYRHSIAASSFDQTPKHVSQKLAEIWSQLPAEKKKEFQDKAAKFEKDQLIQAECEKLNKYRKNYNDIETFSSTINSNSMPGPQTQGNVIITDSRNSYSDDEPELVIDESKFEEYSEDNTRSPLFVPKFSTYVAENQVSYSDQLNTFLKEEDIRKEEIRATMKAECFTTSNFEPEKYYDSSLHTRTKSLTGERFFPTDFSVEKVQNETDDDNEISLLTEKITKELFDYGTQHHSSHTEKKYDLIIQLFKDHGYYPSDYSIEQLLRKHSDLFVDNQSLKFKILRVREKLYSRKESSFLPLSPQLREILISVMNDNTHFQVVTNTKSEIQADTESIFPAEL